MTPHFIKIINSPKMESLLQDYPNSFLLLQHIAKRIDVNTQKATIYPSLVKKMNRDEYRAALDILVKFEIIEVGETQKGRVGNREVRIICQEVVDTTMQKTVGKNTQNYDRKCANYAFPAHLAHINDTLIAFNLHIKNLVSGSLSLSYEEVLHIKNTLTSHLPHIENALLSCTLKINKDIIDKKEEKELVVFQTTSENSFENENTKQPKKQKTKTTPQVAVAPPTEKSLRTKISDYFCLEWYPKNYIAQGVPTPYTFKKSQDGKNLNEIEGRLKKVFFAVKAKEGTDQEILKLLWFILEFGAKTFWVKHITLQILNSRFDELYLEADKNLKAEKQEKAKTQVQQTFDKTRTGIAEKLRKEEQEFLASERALRAAKQADNSNNNS